MTFNEEILARLDRIEGKMDQLIATLIERAEATNTQQRKSPRRTNKTKCTKWMRIEREAVLDWANDPKRNPNGKLPHEVCPTVWNANTAEFSAAALLPKGVRGYRNMSVLRACFYRLEAKIARRGRAKFGCP